jgi:DNA-binding CsgD family transcriptional regulator
VAVLGRTAEQEELGALLDDARRGRSGVLVLSGEAGIGKTALLDDAERCAAGFRVARISGCEAERDLAFAAVHRLLLPFLRREVLPARQLAALDSAFGLTDGPPADRFLVGLAALSLLADAAGKRPLLCVVDDVHWLDDESVASLAFAARRLEAERIVMLFGVRDLDRPRPLDGLPTRQLVGLAEADAVALLRSVVDGPIDSYVAHRLAAETQGSPLALLELATSRSAEQLTAGALTPEPLPIGRRLEDHFLRRVRALPEATQRMLLVASAEGSGDRAVVTAGAELLDVSLDALEPAETAGLLSFGTGIRFRHPLVRSAVYNGAPAPERRRVHAALATAAGRSGDADRRAWHLGMAAIGPDENVAGELDAAGERALRRGGCAASATFFTRAAELSADGGRRVERALAAAQRHLTAGFRIRARHVVAELATDIADPLQRARAARLEGAIRYTVGDTAGTVTILIEAARALHPSDAHTARDTLLQALAAARVTGTFTAPGESEIDVATAARSTPLPAGATPTIGDLLLDGDVALFLDGHRASAPLLRRAIAAIDDDPSDSEDMLRWLGIASWAAGALGDDAALRRLAGRLERSARVHGALVPLSTGLMFLGLAELFDGAISAAGTHLAERAELLEAIGRPGDVGSLVALAWTGDEHVVRAAAAAATARARETRHGWMIPFADYAITVLELGLGDYAAAYQAASKNYADNPFLGVAAWPNLIEAAARCGEHAAAVQALDELTSRILVDQQSSPTCHGIVACGRALLADDTGAEELYQQAITHLGEGRSVLQLARTELLYGEWLRRRKRRADAREQLRAAHATFSRIGAGNFAARALRELAATGERARRRNGETRDELTPQELRIAQLAAVGATNPEIANQLFLSSSTVDYHLRKVYRKLDVRSRRHLSQALPV